MSAVNAQPLPTPWAVPIQRNQSEMPTPDMQGITNDLKERCQQFFKKMPIVTCFILFICIGFYFLDFLLWIFPKVKKALDVDEATTLVDFFSLYPNKIIKEYQVWRLLTYPFFHGGFLHLLFNLLATIPISIQFEKQHGSVQYFYLLNSVFILIPSILYSALTLIPLPFFKQLPSAVGLSGLFFTLLVWQVKETPQINPCVLCNVPAQAYPVILLLVLSLFLPNVSFLGHFLGLSVGYAFAYGLLSYWILREETILRIEELGPVLALSRYSPTRFISFTERSFSSSEPTDLPFFAGQGHTVSSSNRMPTSGSGYHIPFFQSTQDSRTGTNNNNNSQGGNSNNTPNRTLFPGQGHRLGGS